MWIQVSLPSLAALALVAGCTQGSSQIETASMLPRPQVVVVQDFAVWPGEVQLDPGLSGTIDETLGANQLPPRTAKEQQIGQQVVNALACRSKRCREGHAGTCSRRAAYMSGTFDPGAIEGSDGARHPGEPFHRARPSRSRRARYATRRKSSIMPASRVGDDAKNGRIEPHAGMAERVAVA